MGAELALAKALVDAEKRRLSNDIRIQIHLELAEAQMRQFQADAGQPEPNKLDAAEENCRAALDLARRQGDKEIVVQCLDSLARTLAARSDLENVEALVGEAMAMDGRAESYSQDAKIKRLRLLATLRGRSGQMSSAALALEQALEAVELLRGPDHLETADLLTELGDAYRFLGQHAAAQKHLKRAMRMHEQHYGLDSAEAAHDLNLLTSSCEASGKVDVAAAEHERVLALKLRGLGVNLDQLAESQFAMARLYVRWGNPSRARELLAEAIGTFKRRRGPQLAAAYEALADVEEQGGHLREALSQLAHACRVWESLRPSRVREVSRNLECQAQIFDRLHQKEDAAFLRRRLAALNRASGWAEAS
jgi:tetratricopeptide (TPR) repeat protein